MTDASLNGTQGPSGEPLDPRAIADFDFSDTGSLPPDFGTEFNEILKGFASILAARLGHALDLAPSVEYLRQSRSTYERAIAAMPNPTILALIPSQPLPSQFLLEVDTGLGLDVVDRSLGGPGNASETRPLTALELGLLTRHLPVFIAAIRESLEPLITVQPELAGIEDNPFFAHACPPSEVLYTAHFEVTLAEQARSIRLTFPEPIIQALQSQFTVAQWGDAGVPDHRSGLSEQLAMVPVTVRARLNPTKVRAAELRRLRPGDVVGLDHWEDEPVTAFVDGIPLLEGRLGARGDRAALLIERWRTP